MVTFPNLPTDSLYKFLFIGGLFITCLSFFMSFNAGVYQGNANQLKFKIYTDTTFEKVENSKQISNNNKLFEEANRAQLKIAKKVSDILKRQPIDSFTLQNLKNSKEARFADSISKIAEEFNNKYNSDFSKNTAIQIRDDNELSQMLWLNDTLRTGSRILFILGCAMIAFGGVMWYEKIQKYQDRILRLQADELEQNLKGKKKSQPLAKYQRLLSNRGL